MRRIELDCCDGINKNGSNIKHVRPLDSKVPEQETGNSSTDLRDISKEVNEVRSTLGLNFQDWGQE